jgi:hypothetical protein
MLPGRVVDEDQESEILRTKDGINTVVFVL